MTPLPLRAFARTAMIVTIAAELAAAAGQGTGGGVSTTVGGSGGPVLGGGPGAIFTTSGPPVSVTAPSGTGAISGVVTDAATGQPLAGAIVSLRAEVRNATGATSSPLAGQHLTDSKGRFVFTDLGVSNYAVTVRTFGYFDGNYGDIGGISNTTRIALADAQWFRDANVSLWRTGAITGSVLDERGEPVVGVAVTIARRIFVAGGMHLAAGRSVQTDDRGIYRISGLHPGSYIVCVPSAQATVPASVAADASDLLADVAPGYRAAVGRGPQTSGSFVYPTTCAPGSGSDAGPAAIEITRRDNAGVDIRLQPTRSFRVSGQAEGLTDAGGLVVRLVPAWADDLGYGSEAATTLVEPNGRFTFLSVPPGQYRLLASGIVSQYQFGNTIGSGVVTVPRPPGVRTTSSSSFGFSSGDAPIGFSSSRSAGPDVWGRSAVTVAGADITDAVLELRRSVQVRGRLVFEGSTAPPQGVLVAAEPATGDASLGMPTQFAQVAQSDGEFTLDGLMGGLYILRMRGGLSGWMVKSITAGEDDVTDTGVDATPGRDISGVVITMTDRMTKLSGTVRDSSPQPSPASVIVFPSDRRKWTGYGVQPTRLRSANATTSGAFEISGLPAGEYFALAVEASLARSWQDPAWLEQASRAATRVTLEWGATRTVELVKAGGR